ncbi:transposon ty3-i gag-pol polyprotein, partial [Lasius niger]
GKAPKLQSNWEGPFSILKKFNDVVYFIQKTPRHRKKVVHADRLALFIERNVFNFKDLQREVCLSLRYEKVLREVPVAETHRHQQLTPSKRRFPIRFVPMVVWIFN